MGTTTTMTTASYARITFGILCLLSTYFMSYSMTGIIPSLESPSNDGPTTRRTITNNNNNNNNQNLNQNHNNHNHNFHHCNTTYHLIVSGNDGYLDDLLTWWYHCKNVGLCCDPRLLLSSKTCCSKTTFYAEDEVIFEKLQRSKILTVKKSWETGTGFVNYNLTGRGRFTYKKHWRFNHMVSRRPSILYNELLEAKNIVTKNNKKNNTNDDDEDVIVIFSDLDTFLLKDPRPYIVDDNDDDYDKNDNNATPTRRIPYHYYDFWGQDAQNSKTGPFNSGFMAFRPTNTTLSIISQWRTMLENRIGKPSPNQMSLNRVIREHNADDITVKHKLFPIPQFQVGKSVAHFKTNETTILEPLDERIVVFHNNWCDKGCDKVERAKVLGIWHPVPIEEVMG